MSIAEKLQSIYDSKQNIKTSIEAKGVTVGDAPFSQYPDKIASIQGGGGNPELILDYLQEQLEAAFTQYADEGYVGGNIWAWFATDDTDKIYRGSNGLTALDNSTRIIFNDGFTKIGQNLSAYYNADDMYNSGYHLDTTKDVTVEPLPYKIRWKINLTNVVSTHGYFEPGRLGDSNITVQNLGCQFLVSKNGKGWGSNWDAPGLQMMRNIDIDDDSNTNTTGNVRSQRLWYIDGYNAKGYTNNPLPVDATIYRNIKNINSNITFNLYNYAITLDSIKAIIDGLVEQEDGVTKTLALQGYAYNLKRLQRFAPEYITIATEKGWTLT